MCKLNACIVVTFVVQGVLRLPVMCALCVSWIYTMGASRVDGDKPLGSMTTSCSPIQYDDKLSGNGLVCLERKLWCKSYMPHFLFCKRCRFIERGVKLSK